MVTWYHPKASSRHVKVPLCLCITQKPVNQLLATSLPVFEFFIRFTALRVISGVNRICHILYSYLMKSHSKRLPDGPLSCLASLARLKTEVLPNFLKLLLTTDYGHRFRVFQ